MHRTISFLHPVYSFQSTLCPLSPNIIDHESFHRLCNPALHSSGFAHCGSSTCSLCPAMLLQAADLSIGINCRESSRKTLSFVESWCPCAQECKCKNAAAQACYEQNLANGIQCPKPVPQVNTPLSLLVPLFLYIILSRIANILDSHAAPSLAPRAEKDVCHLMRYNDKKW